MTPPTTPPAIAPLLCVETACGVSDDEVDVADVAVDDLVDDEVELSGGSQLSML